MSGCRVAAKICLSLAEVEALVYEEEKDNIGINVENVRPVLHTFDEKHKILEFEPIPERKKAKGGV